MLVISLALMANLFATPNDAKAAVTVAVPSGTELDFSTSNRTSTSNQTSLNGWAYYTNVLTVGTTQIDAKVTTVALNNASIDNYDNRGSASTNETYFQINNTASAVGGYTSFKFEFFNHADNSAATLQNVKITSIDLDSPGRQFTEFNGFNRYILGSTSNLSAYTTNEAGVALADGLVRFTPTRSTSPGSNSNIAADAVEVNFDSISTYVAVFGNEEAQSGYFGVAFKGLCATVTGSCTAGTPIGSPQMSNYTITYNGNNNTSGTAPANYTGNGTTPISGNTGPLVRTGYTFAGWNTAADGSGTPYAANDVYTITGDATLYAQWTAVAGSYAITYDGNSSTGGTVPAVTTGSGSVTLRSNSGTLVRTGYNFTGWNTAANGSGTHYAVSAAYTLNADITLYAEWSAVASSYTITFDANGSTGGSVPAVITGSGNKTLRTNSGLLVLTNYTFKGWNTAADGSGTHYNVSATYNLTADVTLYAEWVLTPQVTYNKNGATGGTTPGSVTQGSPVTIDPNTGNLVRAGYRFLGWNTQANGNGTSYAAGDTPTLPVGTVLYAMWQPIESLAGTGSEAGNLFVFGSAILGFGLFLNAVSRIRRRRA
jgi:uncharacterized repeat protein (TIGR02543 family)